uniref:Uncharacterized protein n=1 Tax=Panagrolaimus superbus TaxID=310955 RepID=A0A914Z0E8_9BILA
MEKYKISDDPDICDLMNEVADETLESCKHIPQCHAEQEATEGEAVSERDKVSEAEEACEFENASMSNHNGDEENEGVEEEKEMENHYFQNVTSEFVLFFQRLALEPNNEIDLDVMYRVMCGRSPCDKKLAYFCDRIEYQYMYIELENPLLTNLDFFDKVCDAAVIDEWTGYWTHDIAHAFHVSTIITKISDPVGIVILSTLIAMEMFHRYPGRAVMRGRCIYVTGEALKFFRTVLEDKVLQTELLQDINARYGREDITEIGDLLHYCMSLGLGWMSAGTHGKMLHNYIIKSFVFDEIPEHLNQFKTYQICQFVMNTVCGDSDGFAITEHFTLCSEENWKYLHSVCTEVDFQIRAFHTYINDRLVMLANEIKECS